MPTENAMAARGRPAKVLSSKDLLELEKFLIDLDFLKKNQQKAIQLLQKEYEALDEKDLNLLKIVHREKNQYQQRQTLLDQIKTKQKNQQKLLANEIEILQLLEKEQNQDNFFRLDRALTSYQKIEKAALEDRIRLENEHKRDILNKTHKKLTEAQKKRNAENQLKYALGGLVLSLWRKRDWPLDPDDLKSVESMIIRNVSFGSKIAKSSLYKEAASITGNHRIARELVLSVIDELPKYKINQQELHKFILKNCINPNKRPHLRFKLLKYKKHPFCIKICNQG